MRRGIGSAFPPFSRVRLVRRHGQPASSVTAAMTTAASSRAFHRCHLAVFAARATRASARACRSARRLGQLHGGRGGLEQTSVMSSRFHGDSSAGVAAAVLDAANRSVGAAWGVLWSMPVGGHAAASAR